jgi:DNA-binding transcriptional MerR regulator
VRVKELADLTGTTVRAIRHYHQIGILPVPGVRGGQRDYDLVHVARLARIRWLARAGVPLSRVAAMLAQPPVGDRPIVADLRATIDEVDKQLAELSAQREQLTRLVAVAERGDQPCPLPPVVLGFYTMMEERTDDERVRRVIRRERDFMELAYYRGDVPVESEVLYEGMSDARLAESMALFGEIADRADEGTEPTDEQIERMTAAVLTRIRGHLGADVDRVARAIDPAVARRTADLYVRLALTHHRRPARATADALLGLIEKAHADD